MKTTNADLKETATWREIHQQPQVWANWASELEVQALDISAWIDDRRIEEIWFSGAGTSAFIGDILSAGAFANRRCISVPTTDFVAEPSSWLSRQGRILNIQFGRSGDSSETVGMLDILDTHRPDIDRLQVTCNANGALACHLQPNERNKKSDLA